jgi:hypothetical protein
MGIFKRFRRMVWWTAPPLIERDQTLDGWIHEALLDDALARPPAGAWDRLRQVIVERQLKDYGMWVLDEPQRDPPESPPMLMSGHDFDRARRIHGSRFVESNYPRKVVIWTGVLPMFAAIVNW